MFGAVLEQQDEQDEDKCGAPGLLLEGGIWTAGIDEDLSGRADIGRSMFHSTYRLPKAVNSRGAVSPAMRAMDVSSPDVMPAAAVLMLTFQTTLDLLAPRAYAASLRPEGTRFNTSSVTRVVVGTNMKASATLADRAE